MICKIKERPAINQGVLSFEFSSGVSELFESSSPYYKIRYNDCGAGHQPSHGIYVHKQLKAVIQREYGVHPPESQRAGTYYSQYRRQHGIAHTTHSACGDLVSYRQHCEQFHMEHAYQREMYHIGICGKEMYHGFSEQYKRNTHNAGTDKTYQHSQPEYLFTAVVQSRAEILSGESYDGLAHRTGNKIGEKLKIHSVGAACDGVRTEAVYLRLYRDV